MHYLLHDIFIAFCSKNNNSKYYKKKVEYFETVKEILKLFLSKMMIISEGGVQMAFNN